MLFSFFGFTLLSLKGNNGDVYDNVLRMAKQDEDVHALWHNSILSIIIYYLYQQMYLYIYYNIKLYYNHITRKLGNACHHSVQNLFVFQFAIQKFKDQDI